MKQLVEGAAYTEPYLCTSDPSDWKVIFYYLVDDKLKIKRCREGINYIKDIDRRTKEAQEFETTQHYAKILDFKISKDMTALMDRYC